jgi:hypothetical protein
MRGRKKKMRRRKKKKRRRKRRRTRKRKKKAEDEEEEERPAHRLTGVVGCGGGEAPSTGRAHAAVLQTHSGTSPRGVPAAPLGCAEDREEGAEGGVQIQQMGVIKKMMKVRRENARC